MNHNHIITQGTDSNKVVATIGDLRQQRSSGLDLVALSQAVVVSRSLEVSSVTSVDISRSSKSGDDKVEPESINIVST